MLKKFRLQSEPFRNVLTLMTGTSISQLIPVLISPVLTRLYTPEDFGLFATYTSIVALISVVSTGKYDLSIMLPLKDSRAVNLAVISLLLTLLVSMTSLIIIALFETEIIIFFNIESIGNWLYLVPASVFLFGVYQVMYMWNNRRKHYRNISNSLISQSVSNAGFNSGFGFMNFQAFGLILTNILGFLFAILVLSRSFFRLSEIRSVCSVKVMLLLARRYKEFPTYTLPQNLVYQGTMQLPIIFIGIVFSSTTLGLFTFAYRILGAPLSLISGSLGSVVYQKSSELYGSDRNKLQVYIKKVIIMLLIVAVIIGTPIIFTLPTLFGWVFGESWSKAGEIGQIISVYLIFSFALTPFTTIYLIAKKNLFYLKWEIIRFVLLVSFMMVFVVFKLNDEYQFFLYFSIINLLLYVFISIPIFYKKSFLWV